MREELLIRLEKMKNNPSISKLDEAATKQCVILPILRTLGWDVDNPNEVTPEYKVESGNVDYSLRLRDENKIFLEVKKTAEDLDKVRHDDQILQYSFRKAVELAILTNGVTWSLYLPMKGVDWKERKFFTIDILEQEIDSVVSNFIDLLAKNNIESGQALRNAETLFKGKQKNETLKESLPEAWSKVVDEYDPRFLDLLADTTEKLCGYKPDNEEVKKYLKSRSSIQLPQRNGAGVTYEGDDFICESKGVRACGKYSSGRFTVFKGSRAIFNETKTIPVSAKKERDGLRRRGILISKDNFLCFATDHEFNSPSAAANVVLARSANGKIEWKNSKGETLGQLVEK